MLRDANVEAVEQEHLGVAGRERALEAPPTSHRRRAMLDAAAVLLLRCAETGRSYWSWTDEEWASWPGPARLPQAGPGLGR
jgi:hypothetical protein